MNKDLQEKLINRSFRLIVRFDWLKFALDMILYVGAVLAILYVLLEQFDWVFAVTVPVMSAVYLLFKHLYMTRQVKKTLNNQYYFIEHNHPNLQLFIPMLDSNRKKYYLKRAALYLEGDALLLDALRQKSFSSLPEEAITIPYGEEFFITRIIQEKNNQVLICDGTLIDTDYRFIVIDEPEIYERLSSLIIKKEE